MNSNSNQTDEKRNRVIAILGVLVFHGIVLAVLLLSAFRTPLPLPGEEGMEVNLGYSDQGMGEIQPEESSLLKSAQPPQNLSRADEEVVTENNEESVALDKVNKKTAAKSESTSKTTNPEPELSKQPVTNPNALYKGKSNKNVTGGSQGNTGQAGDQGKQGGTPDGQGYTGNGGEGNGIGFDLGGRGAKSLPKPLYNSDERGRIVVNIWVNKQGLVTKALAGARGTTISDVSLRKQCEDAARRAVFVADPTAAEEQRGTITYVFEKK